MQEYTDRYVNEKTVLGDHSEDYRRKLKEEMYRSVAEIFAADNPFLKCRERLAEYVISFADWQVLWLKSEGRHDETLSPYISGELCHHIRQFAQNNDELKKIIAHLGELPEDELEKAIAHGGENWLDGTLIDFANRALARICIG